VNPSRIALSILLLSLLCGCPTATQRHFETMKTGNQQANAEMDACVSAAYNSPDGAARRAHLPLRLRDATLQQLSDQTFPTPAEVQQTFAYHSQIQACRKAFLASRAQSEPALVPILVSNFNRLDDDLIALTQRKLSWGEYLRRVRDRAAETEAALQAADHQVVSDLKQEHAEEMAQRQRAAEALAAWVQTQQLINAANRPVITNCSGVGNSINCVTH
jgi:hypothetical protein